MMVYITAGVALVFLAGGVLLVALTGKGLEPAARKRFTMLGVGFAVLGAVASIATMYAQVYYRIPVPVWAGLLVLWLGLAALVVAIVGILGRKPRTYLTLLAVFVLVNVGVLAFMMFSPFGAPVGLFQIRAQQIAEANDFTLLLPEGEQMVTDYLAVSVSPDDETAIQVDYDGFQLRERKAEGEPTEAMLRAIVATGQDPMGMSAPVPDDAESTVLTVDGNPAVGVSYTVVPAEFAEKNISAAMGDDITLLVTVIDGVEVRLASVSRQQFMGLEDGEERYEYVAALTVQELKAIAEKMQPVE